MWVESDVVAGPGEWSALSRSLVMSSRMPEKGRVRAGQRRRGEGGVKGGGREGAKGGGGRREGVKGEEGPRSRRVERGGGRGRRMEGEEVCNKI